jgi:hypothetical protein
MQKNLKERKLLLTKQGLKPTAEEAAAVVVIAAAAAAVEAVAVAAPAAVEGKAGNRVF